MFLVWTGYEMGSSPPGAYTTSKTSLVENIKHGWKINTVANTTTLFAREILQRSSFPGNPNPQTRNPPSENSNSMLRFPCLLLLTPPRPPHQPSPQTTLSWAETLDWPVHFFAVVETWRSTHVSLLHSDLNQVARERFHTGKHGKRMQNSLIRFWGLGRLQLARQSIYVYIPPQETGKETGGESKLRVQHVLGAWLEMKRSVSWALASFSDSLAGRRWLLLYEY